MAFDTVMAFAACGWLALASGTFLRKRVSSILFGDAMLPKIE